METEWEDGVGDPVGLDSEKRWIGFTKAVDKVAAPWYQCPPNTDSDKHQSQVR